MKKKFLSLILAICFALPCIFIFSACEDEEHTDIKANFANTTFVANYKMSSAYERDFDAVAFLQNSTWEDDSLADVKTCDDFLGYILKGRLIDYMTLEISEPTTLTELKQIIQSKLPSVDSFGEIVIGSEDEKTLTYNNVVYDIKPLDDMFISFEIFNHGAEQTEENCLGMFNTRHGGYTSKGYFYSVPNIFVEIEKVLGSVTIDIPLSVYEKDNLSNQLQLSLTFDLYWTIK